MPRIGLVGCGTHANWAVIPAIRNPNSGWELAAVADINAENLARIEVDVPKFADHRAMLAALGDKLDAVYVATLIDSHLPIALDAFARGLHVVCEKPMAPSVADCRAMVFAAARADRVLAVNFETRYYGEFIQARQWIREGRLGRVEAIHVQHFWDGHKTFSKLAARRHRLCDAAGAMDCGIHKADMARYFVGGEWTEIHARGRWLGEEVSQPPHIAILASLDNGVLVTLGASFAYTAHIEPRAYSDVITVVGTEGVINYFDDRSGDLGEPGSAADAHGGALMTLTSKTLTTSLPVKHADHADFMVAFLRDVRDRIEGRATTPGAGAGAEAPMATGEDGLMAQVLVEEANRQAVEARQRWTVALGR
jgi:predicted dehydrogenase